MSLLATKALGSIEIDQSECYQFSDGLYGFQEEREFVLVHEKEESPFLWLQSTSTSELAFVVVEPFLFCKKPYKPELSDVDLEALSLKSIDKQCLIYAIVTIPRDHPEEMTANLQGPIILYPEMKVGRQVISLDKDHDVRVPILKELGM